MRSPPLAHWKEKSSKRREPQGQGVLREQRPMLLKHRKQNAVGDVVSETGNSQNLRAHVRRDEGFVFNLIQWEAIRALARHPSELHALLSSDYWR